MITITPDTPPKEVWIEWAHTHASVKEDALTQPLAAGFEPFGQQIKLFHVQELDLVYNVIAARMRAGRADIHLDTIFEAIVTLLLVYVKNDRSDPEYVRFIGNRKPSDIKRPVLGAQLTFMEDFPAKLKTAKTQGLRDLEPKMAALLVEAKAASNELRAADLALSSFYKTGDYATFIDTFNGGRKALFGQIAEIGHQHPEANLGQDYADGFFLKARRSEGPTLANEKALVEYHAAELAKHQQRVKEMEAEMDAEKMARLEAEEQILMSEQKQLEEEMAALQKQAADKQAALNALAEKLKKK